jgi:hypothetical protein
MALKLGEPRKLGTAKTTVSIDDTSTDIYIKHELSAEDMDFFNRTSANDKNFMRKAIAMRIDSWDGVVSIDEDGNESNLKCTYENALLLLEDDLIYEQLLSFVSDRANFIQR